jgi:hypothetical protein
VKTWQAESVTRAQLLVVLRNDSATPMEFVSSGSTYRILDVHDRAVATGVFTYAVPDRIAPGATAYLVETVTMLFVKPRDVVRLAVVPSTRPTTEAAPLLKVAGVAWRTTVAGLEASGVVTNNTPVEIDGGFVGVLFFGASNELIGAVYDLTDVEHLAPAESRRFSTAYPGTAPIASGDVARAEAIAFPLENGAP